MPQAKVEELIALAKAAAAEAADYQERFGAQDTEARKIVDIIENFLRTTGRVVYGGAAINAHLPADKQFYDPSLYLPDYDFMTPDPLQDCADIIVAFHDEGFTDVEAKFGIHEGTYKIFVNYRPAADITFMPPDIYKRVVTDSDMIDGIHYASVNFLRMNIYLELSRPAGDVKRWEKVYERLLLLNDVAPLRAGRCTKDPIRALASDAKMTDGDDDSAINILHDRIVGAGIAADVIFLSGVAYLQDLQPDPNEVVLLMTERPAEIRNDFQSLGLRPTEHAAMGELLPARTEYRTSRKRLAAVVFETVSCHSYTTLREPAGYRLGSLDLLIQMYYAMYFAELQGYVPVRLLCVIQELIDMESTRRQTAVTHQKPAHDVFPLECVGHQPTLPELKKAHRERVREKQKDLRGALRRESGVRLTRKRRRHRSQTRSSTA
jgi:hypothetical protein